MHGGDFTIAAYMRRTIGREGGRISHQITPQFRSNEGLFAAIFRAPIGSIPLNAMRNPAYSFSPEEGGRARSGARRFEIRKNARLLSSRAAFTVANAPRPSPPSPPPPPPPPPPSPPRPQLFSRVMTPPGRYKIPPAHRISSRARLN